MERLVVSMAVLGLIQPQDYQSHLDLSSSCQRTFSHSWGCLRWAKVQKTVHFASKCQLICWSNWWMSRWVLVSDLLPLRTIVWQAAILCSTSATSIPRHKAVRHLIPLALNFHIIICFYKLKFKFWTWTVFPWMQTFVEMHWRAHIELIIPGRIRSLNT